MRLTLPPRRGFWSLSNSRRSSCGRRVARPPRDGCGATPCTSVAARPKNRATLAIPSRDERRASPSPRHDARRKAAPVCRSAFVATPPAAVFGRGQGSRASNSSGAGWSRCSRRTSTSSRSRQFPRVRCVACGLWRSARSAAATSARSSTSPGLVATRPRARLGPPSSRTSVPPPASGSGFRFRVGVRSEGVSSIATAADGGCVAGAYGARGGSPGMGAQGRLLC